MRIGSWVVFCRTVSYYYTRVNFQKLVIIHAPPSSSSQLPLRNGSKWELAQEEEELCGGDEQQARSKQELQGVTTAAFFKLGGFYVVAGCAVDITEPAADYFLYKDEQTKCDSSISKAESEARDAILVLASACIHTK